jgi:hypothetical protein
MPTGALTVLPIPTKLPHPVRAILAGRMLTATQLAAAIGYGRERTSDLINKKDKAPPAFRARVAIALSLPEAVLFDRAWCTDGREAERAARRAER